MPAIFLDVVPYFLKLLDDDKDLSSGIAAIKTLLMILEKKQCQLVVVIDLTLINLFILVW